MKKILAILPSVVLYGKERSNIEVYNLIKKDANFNIQILVNRNCSKSLQYAIDNLNTHRIFFPNRQHRYFKLLLFFSEYIISNIQLFYYIKRIRPDILFVCSEINFYDNFFPINFFKGKILYRIGDEPEIKTTTRKIYKYIWSHHVIKKVTTFVCISQFIYNAVKETGRNSINDVVIYNYPPGRKKTLDDEDHKYLTDLISKIKFGYIGQIIEQKGVGYYILSAIKILKKYDNCIFYIAGSLAYDNSYANSIKNTIPHEYKDRIIFLDEISNIELFFKNIDILCVPSLKQEPLGNVIVEAKSYSVPCVIFPSGGMPELISHKEDGYICKDQTVNSLFDGMQYYVNNRDVIPVHSRNAFMSISRLGIDRLSFEKKWLNVFHKF